MIKKNIDELVEELVSINKNVLILDTCCILDIIRSVTRQNNNTLISAVEILNTYFEDDLVIVFPSLIESEWEDNASYVKIEAIKHLKKWKESQSVIHNAIEYFFARKFDALDIASYGLDDQLHRLSQEVLKIGLHLNIVESCLGKASYRVIKLTPPAAKGKDSLKDCIIFEEVLLLSELLRDHGLARNIVFASSNTQEYAKNAEVRAAIEQELGKYNAILATSLSEGYYKAVNA